MKLEPSKFCPLINADCKGLGCSWFTQVRGTNPNTGEPVDEWGCAITWLPILLIENSQQQRSTSSAVESMRNELVSTTESQAHVQAHLQAQLLAQTLNSLKSLSSFD